MEQKQLSRYLSELVIMVRTPMVKYLLALTILLSGCASVPRFSSEPQDCEPQKHGVMNILMT